MYQKEEHFNLFSGLNVSEDAQRLLTAGVIASASKSCTRAGATCANRIGATALGTVGFVGTAWAINELVDVVTGFDMIATGAGFVRGIVDDIKDRIDEHKENSHTEPNPDAFNVADHDM